MTFLRGVILARALGPTDFGYAVVLLAVAGSIELIADGGVDQFLVRSRIGAFSVTLGTAHAVKFIGSILIAVLLVILSQELSNLLKLPDLRTSLLLIAPITPLRALVNLDYKLQQKRSVFKREMLIDLVRNSLELAAVLVAIFILDSYVAVIAGLYANVLTQLILSRFVAERPFHMRLQARTLRVMAHFSGPIFANSWLLTLALQGDRLITSSILSASQVGIYAATSSLSAASTSLFARTVNVGALPFAARARAAKRDVNLLSVGSGVVAGLIALAVAGVTYPFVDFTYGSQFFAGLAVVAAAACLQMLTLEQAWYTTLMIGLGRTYLFPVITGLRSVGLITLFFVASPALWMVPYALAVGTFLGLLASMLLLRSLGVVQTTTILASLVRGLLALIGVAWLSVSLAP